MKKTISAAIGALLTAAVSLNAQAVQLYMDGEPLPISPEPVAYSHYIMVPVRPLAERFGAVVEWTGNECLIYSNVGELLTKIPLDSRVIRANGDVISLEAYPQIINGSLMVPSRAITEIFGCRFVAGQDGEIITVTPGIDYAASGTVSRSPISLPSYTSFSGSSWVPASGDTTVCKSEHGSKYHRPDCFVLDGLPFEISSLTLADAQSMKLYPCSYCRPDREYGDVAYESEPTEDSPDTTEPTATIKPSAASIPSAATTSPTSKPTKADDELIPTAPPGYQGKVVYVPTLDPKEALKKRYHLDSCTVWLNANNKYPITIETAHDYKLISCKMCNP